jgi:hypothetical protein
VTTKAATAEVNRGDHGVDIRTCVVIVQKRRRWEREKQVSCGLTLCTRTAFTANLSCLAELAFQRQVVLLEEDDIAEGEEQATLPPLSSSI